MSRRALVDVITSILGSCLVAVALILIWIDRLEIGGQGLYVSELGAPGMTTARSFEVALLLIVVGGTLIGFASKDIRSRVRWLAIWTPSVSLWIACGFFLVASQVTCTYGCPLPYGGPTFDWQDFGHILCATSAFIVACFAMIQVAFAHDHRALARFSLVMAILVGAISATGGILSLARFGTDVGADAELTATTLAIAWVVVYGCMIAIGRVRAQRDDISSSSRLASPTRT
jgi:hypothetical protein